MNTSDSIAADTPLVSPFLLEIIKNALRLQMRRQILRVRHRRGREW